MTRNAARLFAIAVAALTCSTAAGAADIPETLSQWGLLGTWALDCQSQPSRNDVHETWVRRGGEVFLERNGGDFQDSNKVLDASIAPDGLLEMQIEFKGFSQTRVNVITKRPDGRKRAITNHDMRGTYTVRDGKFTGHDRETPWMTRCR